MIQQAVYLHNVLSALIYNMKDTTEGTWYISVVRVTVPLTSFSLAISIKIKHEAYFTQCFCIMIIVHNRNHLFLFQNPNATLHLR